MAELRNYMLVHKSQTGVFKHLLQDAYRYSWVLGLNKPGALSVELPSYRCNTVTDGYRITDFDEDDQLELWRRIGSGPRQLVGEAPFMVSRIESVRTNDSRRILRIEAATPVSILERRINAQDADDGDSNLDNDTIPNDDQMKFVVRNAFGAGAGTYILDPDPVRDLSLYLQVQGNTGQANTGINYTGQIENNNILQVIQRIAEYSIDTNDVGLFFDVVKISDSPYLLEFRTYYGQRGVDRTVATGGANAITLLEDIHISDYTLTFDWTDSLNRVYAGSRGGTGAARTYAQSDDPNLIPRLAVNPFALRESFESSTSDDYADILKEAAIARQERNYIFQATGLLAESLSSVYGVQYGFGDKVSMRVEGLSFDAYIDTESGEFSNGAERLEIGFNTEATRRRSSSGIGEIVRQLNYQRREIQRAKTIERD